MVGQPEITSEEMLQVELISQIQVEISQEVREVVESLVDNLTLIYSGNSIETRVTFTMVP